MTSSNINKIVRGNINLKPWILSKSTNEIVNTCIQKIYKQSPNNFKSAEILTSKPATHRQENKGPLRALKSQERPLPVINMGATSARNKQRISNVSGADHLLNAVMMNNNGIASGNKKTAAVTLASNKKLLKSPNYKIYNSRQFGSSASSSNASIFRRYDERRRNRMQNTIQLNYLLRSFGTNTQNSSNYGLSPTINKYFEPVRNQQIESNLRSLPMAAQVSSAIQRDLMIIDDTLRKRISLRRRKSRSSMADLKKVDPMNGWHHPPSHSTFMSRMNERSIADAELEEQYHRLKDAVKMKQFENITQIEKKTSLLGNVGKRLANRRVSETYDSIAKEQTPRSSPHREMVRRLPDCNLPVVEPVKTKDNLAAASNAMNTMDTATNPKRAETVSSTMGATQSPTSSLVSNIPSLAANTTSRFNRSSYYNMPKKY